MKSVIKDLIALWEQDPMSGLAATIAVIIIGGAFLWLLTSKWGRWWQRLIIFVLVGVAGFFLALVAVN